MVQPLTNTDLSLALSHGSILRVAYQGVPSAYSKAALEKLTRTLKPSRVISSTSRFRRWSSGSWIAPSFRWRILSMVRFTEITISSSVSIYTPPGRFRSLSTTAFLLSRESILSTIDGRSSASPSPHRRGGLRSIKQRTQPNHLLSADMAK
ncbi:unnamed protein product [Eruca vesicaria subsp. sativa]|uniref:Uncharacterized protein n=1 Tax=Eruca vesicaria subsp. sativa TaxID=29727 RepID=A0ABC8IZL3_ERUVS|nr:unnamed protein product [Eruca vesicaria subsp. sativa]